MMRFLTALVFVALASLFSIPAEADNAVMGFGSQSCDKFNQDLKFGPSGAEDDYFAWAQGFMSGINMLDIMKNRPTRDLSAQTTDDEEAALRSYCDAHPDVLYGMGVMSLYLSLPKVKASPPTK